MRRKNEKQNKWIELNERQRGGIKRGKLKLKKAKRERKKKKKRKWKKTMRGDIKEAKKEFENQERKVSEQYGKRKTKRR